MSCDLRAQFDRDQRNCRSTLHDTEVIDLTMEETIVVLPRSAPALLDRVNGFEPKPSLILSNRSQEDYHWTTQTVAGGSVQLTGPVHTSGRVPYSWKRTPSKAMKSYEEARDVMLPHPASSVPSRPITSTVPTAPGGTKPPTTSSFPALNEPQPPAEEQNEILVNLWTQRESAVQDDSRLQRLNVRTLFGDSEPSLPPDVRRPTVESFMPDIALAASSAQEPGIREPQPLAPAIGGADHRSGASLDPKDDHYSAQIRPASPLISETDWETIRSSRENSYMSELLKEMELECFRSEHGDNKAVTPDDSAQERLKSAMKRNRDSTSQDSYGDPKGSSVKRRLTIPSSQTPFEIQPQVSSEQPKLELSEEYLFIAKLRNPYTPEYMTWPQVHQRYQEKFGEICSKTALRLRYTRMQALAGKQSLGNMRARLGELLPSPSIWGEIMSPTTAPWQESTVYEEENLEPWQLKTEQGSSDVADSVEKRSDRGCLARDVLGESHLESGNEHPGSETSGWTKQALPREKEPVPTILGNTKGLRPMCRADRQELSEVVNGERKCPLCDMFKADSTVIRLSSKTDRYVCGTCAQGEEKEPVSATSGSLRGQRPMWPEDRRKLSEVVNGRRECPLCHTFKRNTNRLSLRIDRYICGQCARLEVMPLGTEPVSTTFGNVKGLRHMAARDRRRLSEVVNGRRKCGLCHMFKANTDRLSSKTDRYVCNPCYRRELLEAPNEGIPCQQM